MDKRKFPGPAGLLPPINVVEELKYKFARITDKRDQKKESDHQEPEDLEMLLSREELIETNEAWKEIVDQEDLIASRTKYNTEFIKKEVKDGMALKVPVFCCVIRTIDITAGLDMSCEFMDDKGEICGVFHRYVILKYWIKILLILVLIIHVFSFQGNCRYVWASIKTWYFFGTKRIAYYWTVGSEEQSAICHRQCQQHCLNILDGRLWFAIE